MRAIGKFAALFALAKLLDVVHAQTPFYTGELLLLPGLNNGQCLTAAQNRDGAPVTLQPCTGAAAQKWTFTEGSVKVFGDKCLDVPSGNMADGTQPQIWTCASGSPNQQWQYTGDYRLTWAGKCLDVPSGNTADGSPVQMWQCSNDNPNQVWNTGYHVSQLPETSQEGQYGTNDCARDIPDTLNPDCQTLWINSAEDFCVWGPPEVGTIGDIERKAVAYCTKAGRGARVIPNGTLKGVHFVQTPDFVQVTGVGDFTKINIPKGDDGGEMDGHGADGRGNPIGGLVYGNGFGEGRQYFEWTNFMSENMFCIRACVGPNAAKLCQHIYDIMGCEWNIPANYEPDEFENCEGDSGEPMGVYGTSTWYQGVSPTPAPHPAPSSSNCVPLPTVGITNARKKRENGGMERRGFKVSEAVPTPPPTVKLPHGI